MQQNQDLKKIKAVLLRRKGWLIIPALLTVLAAAAVALLLPNIYRSTSTVLIQEQEIPKDLVASTVTGYAEQRIQSITQEVTSRARILKLVEKYDLLPNKREKLTTDDLVKRIKDRITIEPINAEINNGGSTRPSTLMIAFSLSFEDESPRKAQAVTNEIASFYLEKNLQARSENAQGTTQFLQEQLFQLRADIDATETKLAQFRKEHLEQLPEFTSLNLQKVDQLQSDLTDLTMQIRSLEGQRTVLQDRLATLDPYAGGGTTGQRILSLEEQLRQAQLEQAQLVAKYSSKHPLVKAKEREIALLTTQVKGPGSTRQLRKRRQELEQQLAEQKARYSESHPAVKKTQRELDEVSQQLAYAESVSTSGHAIAPRNPTNPAYMTLKADLDKTQVSLTSLTAEKKRKQAQLKELYQKLYSMPEVAKQYSDLSADYDIKKKHYAELQQKYLEAKVAQGMEEEKLGENFEVVEPAFLPEKPFKPNRLAIILIGFVLGIGLSVGLASLREFTDGRIHDQEELKSASGLTILCQVPAIITARDRRRKRVRRFALTATFVCAIAGAVFAFHYLVMDLYIFYAKLSRLIETRFLM